MIAKILQDDRPIPKGEVQQCFKGRNRESGWDAYKAYRRVVGNKGSCGVDGMQVGDLQEYLSTHQRDLVREILLGKYLPSAIRGVEIPKSNDERPIHRNFHGVKIGSEPAAYLQGGLADS